jgi:hypothetical protein
MVPFQAARHGERRRRRCHEFHLPGIPVTNFPEKVSAPVSLWFSWSSGERYPFRSPENLVPVCYIQIKKKIRNSENLVHSFLSHGGSGDTDRCRLTAGFSCVFNKSERFGDTDPCRLLI